jgi:hypothetical protein
MRQAYNVLAQETPERDTLLGAKPISEFILTTSRLGQTGLRTLRTSENLDDGRKRLKVFRKRAQ